jgi:hypothetical protein
MLLARPALIGFLALGLGPIGAEAVVAPPDAIWRAAGSQAASSATTYCWDGEPAEGVIPGLCADGIAPDCSSAAPPPALLVPDDQRVRVRVTFGFTPRRVIVIRNAGSPDATTQTLTARRRVSFRVDASYQGATAVFVYGPKPAGGDAFYPVCIRRR